VTLAKKKNQVVATLVKMAMQQDGAVTGNDLVQKLHIKTGANRDEIESAVRKGNGHSYCHGGRRGHAVITTVEKNDYGKVTRVEVQLQS
jgi:hypothetical protein